MEKAVIESQIQAKAVIEDLNDHVREYGSRFETENWEEKMKDIELGFDMMKLNVFDKILM